MGYDNRLWVVWVNGYGQRTFKPARIWSCKRLAMEHARVCREANMFAEVTSEIAHISIDRNNRVMLTSRP